jgi:biotin transporter BioY
MEQAAIGYRLSATWVRVGAVVLGAALVAAAAQVSVPLPGTPVPMTLQPMAVLLVGGLLGAPLGALSMILYLAMGAAGLPVFTPTVPLFGVARLFGPTGGLLAYPLWLGVGAVADGTRVWRVACGGSRVWCHSPGWFGAAGDLTGNVSAARFGTILFLPATCSKSLCWCRS